MTWVGFRDNLRLSLGVDLSSVRVDEDVLASGGKSSVEVGFAV